MHLTVFGSTRGTGAQVVRLALDAGHTVTAAARNPADVQVSHERLHPVRADVLDLPSLSGSVTGADAVISALGASNGRQPTTLYSAGVTNILDTMRTAGVRRFIGLSAQPVTPRAEAGLVERWVVYPILYRFFGAIYADMARMEQVLRHSETDWTIVRPPRLTEGPLTERYRMAVNHHLRGARTISRSDLAAAILDLLDNPDAVRTTVAVAY